MIMVKETAKTLDEGIKNLMAGAKQDYFRWSTNNGLKDLGSEGSAKRAISL